MNLKKLSGYHIKYIALFSMLLDHIGVIFQSSLPKTVYFLLRAIGRLSFPLFCFILVEGFFHTGNQKKYQQRLFIFAILSEIPYDLAFGYLNFDTVNIPYIISHLQYPVDSSLSAFLSIAFQQQNVLFTLFLGFTAMLCLENIQKSHPISVMEVITVLLIFCCLSEVFRVDCGAAGILCILAFYYTYKKRGNSISLPLKNSLIGIAPVALLTNLSLFPVQLFSLADSLILRCYNGKKGTGNKYLFYLFYPLHLLLLYLFH